MTNIERLIEVYGCDHVSRVSIDDETPELEAAEKYMMTVRDIRDIREYVEQRKKSRAEPAVTVLRRRVQIYHNPNPTKYKQKSKKPDESKLEALVNKFKK